MESHESKEKIDQAKAKQAHQWATLVRQVGPLVLGDADTVVLLFFFCLFFFKFIYLVLVPLPERCTLFLVLLFIS